jgi:hypothetical protein
LDIICAKCGKHFSSIESAREHNGHCKGALKNEELHWIPSQNNKLTPEEWDKLLEAFGRQSIVTNPIEDTKKNNPINKNPSTQLDNFRKSTPPHGANKRIKIPKWGKAIILIILCSLAGLTINLLTDEFFPIFLLIGFSVIFSIERWFVYYIKKYKAIGILYRLILNLVIISLLIFLIWFGIHLFSQQFNQNVLISSLIFIAEIVLFIWLCIVVKKNSWRRPSMKLTLFCVVTIFLIFAFAGVEPMTTYKNNTLDFFSSSYKQISEFLKKSNNPSTQAIDTSADIKTNSTTKTTTITSIKISNTTITSIKTFSTTSISTTTVVSDGIDFETGIYDDYYLGLVKSPEGVISGTDCYDEFIILINNKNATNPTYAQLLAFLETDKTDEYPYQYVFSPLGFYYGSAESNLDLEKIKTIIDGIFAPDDPNICADFAERLHNNAEKAGIRCGYISLNFDTGEGHALNVFETTDRGLIYVDDTGISSYGPSNCDKIVNVKNGEHYIPISIFPESGWSSTWEDMGIIEDIFTTWDGEWN